MVDGAQDRYDARAPSVACPPHLCMHDGLNDTEAASGYAQYHPGAEDVVSSLAVAVIDVGAPHTIDAYGSRASRTQSVACAPQSHMHTSINAIVQLVGAWILPPSRYSCRPHSSRVRLGAARTLLDRHDARAPIVACPPRFCMPE